MACNFAVLVHSYCSQQPCFFSRRMPLKSSDKLVRTSLAVNNRHSLQLSGEHSGAFSSHRVRYLPRELVETKQRAKRRETYTHQVARNTTPSECLCCAESAGCVRHI